MKQQFSNAQLFSIVDGRLFDSIGDVYDVLNHVCDDQLMTHHLPTAFGYLKLKNPEWLQLAKEDLKDLPGYSKEGEFGPIVKLVNQNPKFYDIPQLKDEFDTSDFGDYMIENSLLK